MTDKLNDNDKFFIIKRIYWSHKKTYEYDIVKSKAFALTPAIRILLASEQLEDNKDITYHLQKAEFQIVEQPLILDNEVKDKSWKDYISKDLPF